MVVDIAESRKEVLAFLIRVSQLAGKALANLNKGNPFDAVRLIRVIAKLDIRALNVLANVPNYEVVKPYHIELINECKAILALSQTALNEVSPELKTWPAEKLAKYTTFFQSCLEELDKEVKTEKQVEYWLKQAEEAFMSREKAWTHSRSGLEGALESLNWLVQDENAIKQSAERFSKVFRGVKHQDPKKLVEDLIRKRLKVRAVVKFILENAFKNIFTFQGHNWFSELTKVSGLPEENIKELEAIRQQLLGSTAFVKGNVHYLNIRHLLEKLVSLSQHARKVERALELTEETAKEQGKTEEELLRDYWESRVHNGFVYHGTSSIFIENLQRFGLSSEGIGSEGSPFKPEDYKFFLEVSKKAYGENAPHLQYFTQDVTQGFFLEANYRAAVGYAKQGPERIRFMLDNIYALEEEFRRGLLSGRVSQSEVKNAVQILQRYEAIMSRHKPVVLHIPLSSPALLDVLKQNGPEATLVVEMLISYDRFKQYALQEFGFFKEAAAKMNDVVKMIDYLRVHGPLDRFFHNRPLKGAIPWAAITKAEYV